jgi:hypothetical protein
VGRGDFGGGSLALARLIDKAGGAILADFQQEYGLNLIDLLKEGSGYEPSTILVLVNQLPLASRTVAALRGGDQFIGWDVDRYYMATLIDAVNQVAYVTAAANSKRKPKAPKPMPRPSRVQKNAAQNNPFRQRIAAAKKAKGG